MMRRDWWRFWFASRRQESHRNGVSITLHLGERELCLGYRRKRWVL